jgi:cell division topological specificity factor
MALLSFLFPPKTKTAVAAKERLQIIIARERGGRQGSGNDFLPALHKELLDVISKYTKVRPDDIKLSLDRQGNLEVLEVNVVLPDTDVAH